MRDILIQIIAQMNVLLFDCKGFYGNDWYLSFASEDDKVNFSFKTISFDENLELNTEVVNLEWFCTKRSSQNSIDESGDATLILAIKKFNDKFKMLIRSYTSSQGQQIFSEFQSCTNEELYDSTSFELPVIGYYCTWSFTKIMDVKC